MPFNKQFFIKPPPIMLQQLAQERVISRYESLLETWSKVLMSLAKHANEIRTRVRPVGGGFSLPYGWQEDLPGACDLGITEDPEARLIIIRMLEPTPRLLTPQNTGWEIPDEQKRTEDASLV